MPIINDIDLLNPKMIPNVKYLAELVRKRMPGYSLYLNETIRELSTQMAYYSRGRCPVSVVRDYFKRCRLWAVTDNECVTISTKTLYSKHIDGLAVDAYLYDIAKQKILYNPGNDLWLKLFTIAEEDCGLDACADGKYNAWHWDWAHMEFHHRI